MSNQLHILEGGGRVMVVVGDAERPSFQYDDPRIEWRTTKSASSPIKDIGPIPSNVRYIMGTHLISHEASKKIREWAKSMRAVYQSPMTKGEIKIQLKNMGILSNDEKREAKATQSPPVAVAPPTSAPILNEKFTPLPRVDKGKTTPRGFLKILLERADLTKPATEEAKRLLPIAHETGATKVTVNSIENAINITKRAIGLGSGRKIGTKSPKAPSDAPATPAPLPAPPPPAPGALAESALPVAAKVEPAAPPPPAAAPETRPGAAVLTPPSDNEVIRMLDDAIVGLQLVRERIIQAERDSAELTKLKKLLKGVLEQ